MHRKKVQSGKELIRFIETCYLLYEQKMYQAAYCILNDDKWSEDAVQEAFFKLMKGRVYFEEAESEECKKYLITVIKHSAIDIYNKKKKEQEILCFFDEKACKEKVMPLYSGEEEENIRELFLNLRPRYYDVVECLIIKNLTVKETSKKLGISEANVRKRFERAKKFLKHEK